MARHITIAPPHKNHYNVGQFAGPGGELLNTGKTGREHFSYPIHSNWYKWLFMGQQTPISFRPKKADGKFRSHLPKDKPPSGW